MSDRLIQHLLGIVHDARLASLRAMNDSCSKVSGVPLDLGAYTAHKERAARCDRIAARLRLRRLDNPPEQAYYDHGASAFEIACRDSVAPVENVSGNGHRCVCELDETAVRVHKALVWDIPFFANGGHVPKSIPAYDRATVAPEPHRRFPFRARIEDGSLVLSKRPESYIPHRAVTSGDAAFTTIGLRPYDPPKDARDWAKIVSGFCPADKHFPNVDLEMALGKPVFTSSDDEKVAENERESEAATFAEERMPWNERFEARGEDADDRMKRAQRRERGLREAEASKQRADAMNAPHESTTTRHEGSMRARWTKETGKGRKWVATKQRIEKTRWQEFYRLSRQLGRNPATPAAKAWVESVGMDEALKKLRAAVDRQPIAA